MHIKFVINFDTLSNGDILLALSEREEDDDLVDDDDDDDDDCWRACDGSISYKRISMLSHVSSSTSPGTSSNNPEGLSVGPFVNRSIFVKKYKI